VRYAGVGAMAVGGIASLWRVRQGLVQAVRTLRGQLRRRGPERPDPREADLGPGALAGSALLCTVGIAAVYWRFTGDAGVAVLSTGAMLVLSFFFVAVASYIVGLVGNSNSPVSGMTITAVLATGLLLYVCGYAGTQGMVAMLGVAAIVCCAACTSGDTCNDLKTGHLVGASPYKQQLMQMGGVLVAAFVMAPVLQLLHNAYTIGSSELGAPQAALFASLAQGFFGDQPLPWAMVGFGAALGLVVLAADALLARRGSAFRLHLMPLAVGIYLPFGVSLPMLIGGIFAHLRERAAAREPAGAPDALLHRGILLSSGLIAGESLMGVGIALLVTAGIQPFAPELPAAGWLTGAACAAGLVWFWRNTAARSS
jgi:putative OPT family oligopeptide transporter